MRLLLIEDEERLADALSYMLRKNKYGVDVAFDGETGQAMAETGVYDLIILDRMLPYKEGVEVLKDLRLKNIFTPVILLTAKDAVSDRVAGLDAGADDYLVKPFAMDELLARIRALSRRPLNLVQEDCLEYKGVVLNPLQSEMIIESETCKLTPKESLLLELFMRHPGQVFSKEKILDNVWGMDSEVERNNVEIYIHYLRKKLERSEVRITTVRGIGYCLKEAGDVS
ncbi:response regulator transcription factor [Desulfitobacterium sp. Sab5]|uniref:response regulator transcription factor n=1 Tax=Desulfitobacterium TaxID=36853 RepID=UPI003CEAD06F